MTRNSGGRLAGKVALITGAGQGMGRAAARLFAAEGAHVGVLDIDASRVHATVEEIRASRGTVLGIVADVSAAEDMRRAVDAVVNEFSSLQILYNNAGIWPAEDGPVSEVDEDVWQRILAVNLTGVYLGCRYGIPAIVRAGGGSVINTSSPVVTRSLSVAAAYAASKGGVLALTRSVAQYYGRWGVRANALLPSGIATAMSAAALSTEGFMAAVLRTTPLGRLGEPEDVAQAALYLASDESSYVSGVALAVDGGWLVGPPTKAQPDHPE
jgi:NAD(P)-dependent dehydrogenase (short-subunit alcohol dehydrogenase family)